MATVPSAAIDEQHAIPAAVLDGAKELGLFGLQIPEEFNGLGLTNTAYSRVAEEIVMDPSLAVTLMAHQSIGLKGILLDGTPEQKAKYLPKLATGEHLAAFCLTEPTVGSDAAGVKLLATPSPDGKGWVLNGQKMWISNGGIATIYTVFARTVAPDGSNKMTAFIVDRSAPGSKGLVPGPPEKKLGIRGSNTVVLNFDNVFVPSENVLGEVHSGFRVAMRILNNGRFGMGAATGGGIRRLIGLAGEYAKNRPQFGRPISEYGLIQEKFARMAADAYAIEAMSYATTALIDGPGLDMSVEAAACKIYGSEAMFRAVNDCIQILGGMGFASGGAYPFERLMRDSRILLIFEGTNEILRLFIGLTCIQAPGAELKDMSAKLKNPLTALPLLPELLKQQMAQRYGVGTSGLTGITSALSKENEALGGAVAGFQGVVQSSLMRYGKNIPDHQLQVARIANIAIDLYGWICVLSRATQAEQRKVPHLEHELTLARMWIAGARQRIKANVHDCMRSERSNGDADIVRVAKESLDAGKYLPQHPVV